MDKTLALWRAEHVNFTRLLDLLDGELQVFHAGGMPRYDLMQDIMYYMTHYSDVLHHPKEELVFAKLKARNKAIGVQVDALSVQHASLHVLGDALVRDLEDVVNGAIVPRERIEQAAQQYVSYLRSHMRIEEVDVLPWAAKLLNDKDWVEISGKISHIEDPLFGKTAEVRYASLREHIAREARAAS
jgi:hemerythrin-like domain-containing protein